MAERRQMLHQVVMYFRTWISLADKEALIAKMLPRYRREVGEGMLASHRDKNALIPKMEPVTTLDLLLTG
jgi:hypothetical protein